MRTVQWFTGARILKAVLDWFQDARIADSTERRQDYSTSGILKEYLSEFDIVPGTNNTPSNPSAWIKDGVAYDINGDRVAILDIDVTFDVTQLTHTTDNGLGVQVATPRSTGSKNIPLTTGAQNYIWIDYLQVTDDSVFTAHKVTRERLYYKKQNGYKISVTLVDVAPTSTAIRLGNIDLTLGGEVTTAKIFKTNRIYSTHRPYRQGIKTVAAGKANRTFSYNYDTEYFLDDHIKAVGSGTPSATNPHGLTIVDIGGGDLSVQGHQQDEHSGAILGALNSFNVTVTQVTPGWDIFSLAPLDTFGIVITPDGKRFTAVFNTVSFSNLDPTGLWYIYIDSVDEQIKKSQTDPRPDQARLLLYTVEWVDQGGGDFDLLNVIDYRPFGSIGSKDIQYDYVMPKGATAARPATPKPGHLYVNDTLGIIERYTPGTWDNGSASWQGAGWESIAINLPPGTRMVFYQATAPTGWAQVGTHNDKALRVVSGPGGGFGGSVGFISGLAHTHTVASSGAHIHTGSVDGHILTIPQMPAHTHSAFNNSGTCAGGGLPVATPTVGTTGSTGGNQPHSHTYTTPSNGAHIHTLDTQLSTLQYVDVIICEKL